jgi:hypothetical protein
VSFIAELKRRNVIRMAGLYVVGAWLLIQIAETLLPIFHTPDWVLQALVVLLPNALSWRARGYSMPASSNWPSACCSRFV